MHTGDDAPQWDDLRYFLAVARTGRLLRAGKALGVRHTTVGRRVDALERGLGVQLFHRTADGWKLTRAPWTELPFTSSRPLSGPSPSLGPPRKLYSLLKTPLALTL